jgi:hypothetical protein
MALDFIIIHEKAFTFEFKLDYFVEEKKEELSNVEVSSEDEYTKIFPYYISSDESDEEKDEELDNCEEYY